MPDKPATLGRGGRASTCARATCCIPVVGHTRWTAATREVVRQWWGRDPQFTLVDAVAVEPGRAVLSRRHWCARSSLVTQETLSPTSPPTRGSRARTNAVRSRSSTGRSSRSHSDSRRRARGLPAIVTRSIAGSSMAAERRLRARRHPVRRGRSARAARPRRRAPARAGRRPRRQRRAASAAARRRVGRAGRAPGRDRHRRAHRRRPAAVVASRSHSRPPRPRGRRVPDGRAPGRAVHRRRFRSTATARTTTSGSTRAPRHAPAPTSTTRGSSSWVLDVETQEQWVDAARRGARRRAAREGRARFVARRREACARPISTRRSTRGSVPRCGVRAISPARVVATGANAVLAGAGVANLSAWLGVQLARAAGLRRAAHRRDRIVGLRRDARRSVRAQPSQLPDRDDA